MKSELSILEEFGADLAPTQDDPPAEVRHRVLNGMRQPTRRPRLSAPRGVRLAWGIGTPAVIAAAVVAALVASQSHVTGGEPAPPRNGTGGEARSGVVPPATQNARQVLLLTAQHLAATPVLDVRPDQFLFIDSVEVKDTYAAHGAPVSPPLRTRTWLSVDGTHDGLVQQSQAFGKPSVTHLDGCKDGRQAETIDRPETTPRVACTPEPAYQRGLIPDDPDRLLTYVQKFAVAHPNSVYSGDLPDGKPGGFIRLSANQRAFLKITDILFSNHLPAVQAAALQAAARIAGVEVRLDVTDVIGRAGVAVTRTEAGFRYELVFDPTTYRFLGENIVGTGRTSKVRNGIKLGTFPKPGEVVYKSALLRVTVVDKAGARS